MTAAPVLARSLKWSLHVSRGENQGKVYSFNKPVVTIGRGPQNDIVLTQDPKISRQHVEIRLDSGFLKITNLSSRNFILVDGEKTEKKLIQKSVNILIGDTSFDLRIENPVQTASLQSAVTSSGLPATQSNLRQTQNSPTKPLSIVGSSSVDRKNNLNSFSNPQPTFGQNSNPAGSAVMTNPNAGRIRFYIIIAIVGGIAAWFLMDSGESKKTQIGIRTEGDIVRAIEDSALAVKELKAKQDGLGQNTVQFRAAEEHYVRGFRDYGQRQYARAAQSFQAALSFYPAHELAKKYLQLSLRKFEELVDANMSLGRKYYQKQNFRLCQNSFAKVMIMLKDSSKPKYKEAKQFHDECQLRAKGGF